MRGAQVIKTICADSALIREHLAKAAGSPDESRMVHLAAVLDDLCLTLADSDGELEEVKAKIPEHLIYSVNRVDRFHVVLHGRVDALPSR